MSALFGVVAWSARPRFDVMPIPAIRRPFRVAGFFLLAGMALAGHAALFDDNVARRQIAEERKRVDDVSARIAGQSQQLDAISGRLGKVEEAVGRNQGLLELHRDIELLKQDLARIRGQLEVLNNGIDTVQKRQRDFYVDLDTRLRRLENPVVPPAASTVAPQPDPSVAGNPPATAAGAAASVDPVPAGASAAEVRTYEAAQNLRRIGNYQGAIVAFQNFVKQYPRSPLASSAQYWIGDSYFNVRDYRLAIASQRQLLISYPDSAKVPDALLNIASSQAELGETASARKTMDEIVAKHPASEAAEKARRRITTLR